MIAAAECSPDVLVLSGDVANRGEAESYVRLRPTIDAALERFGAKLLVAPGNHDDVALLRAYLLGRGAERGPLDEVVRVGGLRVIGLDSSVPGEDHGELDDAQIAALAGELAEPAPDGTVLAIHHPPIWSTTPMSELVALRDPQRLADVIRGSDVRLILGGHTHRVKRWNRGRHSRVGQPIHGEPRRCAHARRLRRARRRRVHTRRHPR